MVDIREAFPNDSNMKPIYELTITLVARVLYETRISHMVELILGTYLPVRYPVTNNSTLYMGIQFEAAVSN